jgi:hypothetical protein
MILAILSNFAAGEQSKIVQELDLTFTLNVHQQFCQHMSILIGGLAKGDLCGHQQLGIQI